MLYEMLAGRRPFAADSVFATMAAVCDAEPAPIEASPELRRLSRSACASGQRSDIGVMGTSIGAGEGCRCAHEAEPVDRRPSVCRDWGAGARRHRRRPGRRHHQRAIDSRGPEGHRANIHVRLQHQAQDVRGMARRWVSITFEGQCAQFENRIRVTAHLIAASDGTQLWSKRYDRELTDVFEIQGEISNAIATELKLSLTNRPIVKATYLALPQVRSRSPGTSLLFPLRSRRASRRLWQASKVHLNRPRICRGARRRSALLLGSDGGGDGGPAGNDAPIGRRCAPGASESIRRL